MELNARFELGESVGRDELGEVIRATELETGRKAAIKRFEPWALANEDGRIAYEKALRALRRIRPARTPPVAAFQLQGPSGWIASRWVDAPSLASIIESSGTLGVDDACSVACGLLDALQELHSTGSAHGGLSPRKVLLANGVTAGSVVITDPYQHCLYSVADPVKTSRTDPDRYMGLPQYFSPEQAQGKQPDERSDLYVVGLLMYEMLTGKSPFASNSVGTTLKRQIFEKPLPLRLAKPGLKIPAELENLILKALAKEPEKRFASAREFRRAVTTLRENAEEAMERLASPMGIAPTGVLAGEDVPTDDHPESDPVQASVLPFGGSGSLSASAGEALSGVEGAPESAEGDSSSETASDRMVGNASATDSARELDSEDVAVSDNNFASGMSADFEVADANSEQDDTDSDGVADSTDSGEGGSTGGTSAASDASDPRRNKKDKKNKKNKKTGNTGVLPAVVASPALSKREDKSAAGVTPGATDAGTKASDGKRVADAAPRNQVRLTGPVTAAPLDVDNDDELGWFAEGSNEEAIAAKLHIAAPHVDEAQRNSRFFAFGVVALLLVIVGVVAAITTMTPTAEEPSRDRDDEESASAAETIAATPSADTTASPLAAVESDTALAMPPELVDGAQLDGENTDVDALDDINEPDAAEASGLVNDVAEELAAPDVQPEVAEPEQVAVADVQVEVAPPVVPVAPTPERAGAEAAVGADSEAAAAAEREERRTRARELAREGDGLRSSNPDRARELYREAISLDSSVGAAHFGLGEIAFQARDFESAVTHYRAATRNGGRAAYYTKLGQAYFRLDNRDAAIEAFEQAIERGDASAQPMLDRVRGQ
jgi:serine/threonine protein kinase/tetratricopeptide (TPR) repeat protein